MPISQQKLKDLLTLLQDGLTKADFENFIKSLMEAFLKREKKFDDKFSVTLEDLKTQISNLLNGKDEEFGGLKNNLEKIIARLENEQRQNLNFLRDKVAGLRDGARGEQGLTGPAGPPGAPGSPDSPKDIVDKLTGLDEDGLHIEDIWKLQEALDEIKAMKTQRVGGGFSAIAWLQHIVDDETPTGTVNGVNTDFVIGHAPSPTGSLKVFLDGQRMKLTTDYTFSARTITFLTAPLTDSIITVDYLI